MRGLAGADIASERVENLLYILSETRATLRFGWAIRRERL